MFRRVDFCNRSITDRQDGCAARCGEVEPEVQALSGAIRGITLKIRAKRVAVALSQIPGVWPGRIGKGQTERPSGSDEGSRVEAAFERSQGRRSSRTSGIDQLGR